MTLVQFDDSTALVKEKVTVIKCVRATPESLNTQVFVHLDNGSFFEVQCGFESAVAKWKGDS